MQDINKAISIVVEKLFNLKVDPELARTDEQFGDYASNVAMQLGKQLGRSPREVAQQIVKQIHDAKGWTSSIKKVEVAGPGFINLTLSDEVLWDLSYATLPKSMRGKIVIAEYSDPNPFKVLHAGHVYTTVVGDCIARLLEETGAKVHRVNYGGDVGLHVGKTMWAILRKIGGEKPEELDEIPVDKRTQWMSDRYVEGNTAYETKEMAKKEIVELNKKVYELHKNKDRSSAFARIYWLCRGWSYDSFNSFYVQLGTKLEKYYPESEVAQRGLEQVKKYIGKVFEESDGAIVFKGEKYGLHTRVFVNQKGIPTYEAKEIGLILQKYDDYKFDKSVVVTGNEQQEYMAVVLCAINKFLPNLAKSTQYIPHGMVKLVGGIKMSSRKGNIITADQVLEMTKQANIKAHGKKNDQSVLAAIKYAFLRQRIGGDILYDPNESVAIEGNSGPYLQYAHARARSILRKANRESRDLGIRNQELEVGERRLLRKIGEYTEVVERATNDFTPHHICTYIYELAQVFNSFYELNKVIGNEREALRLELVRLYADTLKKGLDLLNIVAPDKM